MEIQLVRPPSNAKCTIGKMFIDGVDNCYTLEDIVRPLGEKVFGQTAIPFGRYKVVITFSNHFQRDLPLLIGVPDFEGVRIHPGNTAADTEGCILTGLFQTEDSISHSQDAFNKVYPQIKDALDRGEEVWINITPE